MRKATKTIISFAVVLIAGLNFVVPAFAQDPFSTIAIGGIGGASGAGLFGSMAGMSGIDISWPSAGADPLDAMWNVLNPDHVYFSGEKHEADPQTDPEDVWDYITVDIGDWLDAQSDFIINFAQTYNVTDNDSGSTSSVISVNGIPITEYTGNKHHSVLQGVKTVYLSNPAIDNVFYFDGYELHVQRNTQGLYSTVTLYKNGVQIHYSNTYNAGRSDVLAGMCYYYNTDPNTIILGLIAVSGGSAVYTYSLGNVKDPSESISYTSGSVNTSVFDGWESAKVKIPHSISGLSPNWTIPDFTNAINNLWEQHLQGQIVIEDTDQPVPPPPIPDTPLGEVPFPDWIDLWGQGIYQQLENQSDTLDLIGSNGIDAIEELESIDTNTEDLVEVAESIDTNIGVGNGILGGIRSLAQSAVNYLEGIAEHVGELVEEIVAGTETLIAGILNQIPQAFGVIFGPIKQASSIWHYVVEWITSIGAPFQFIWSMASGTSYYIILPVYASLAAAVVLAFFKRFGR